jgi:hypothetical protein
VGPQLVSVSGSLDFLAHPSDVRLYQVTLAAGHFWQLGLELDAERDGSSLKSALALFDAQGHPLATDTLGRWDDPNDPYLFAGLAPGTYYVGVSGVGDLPGQPGGYDLVSGAPGSVAQDQPGGAFTLKLVADPADAPIHLLSLALDHADPLDPTPTGLTLQFSGALRLNDANGNPATTRNNAVEVVDQSGHVWPVTDLAYDEAEARVSFLFLARPPAGRYTVRLPELGGLVDLAGQAPLAPGEPAGTLGTFTVATPTAPADPHDLGAILPDAAKAGVSTAVQIAPGGSIIERFVITYPSLYTLSIQSTGGALAISRTGPDGTFAIDTDQAEALHGIDVNLAPGVYQLRLTATGSQPASVHMIITDPPGLPDSILANGIGQGPALDLRLIAPTADVVPVPVTSTTTTTSTSSPAPTGSGLSLAGSALAPGRAFGSGSTSAVASATAQSVALFLTPGSAPIGSPTAGSLGLAAVGPTVTGGMISLADNGLGLLPAIRTGSTARWDTPRAWLDRSSGFEAPQEPAILAVGPAAALAAGAGESDGDVEALAQATWTGQLNNLAAQWLWSRGSRAAGTDFIAESERAAEPIELARDDTRTAPKLESEASLSPPYEVGIIAVLALRLDRRCARWWKRKRAQTTALRRFVRISQKHAARVPTTLTPLPMTRSWR